MIFAKMTLAWHLLEFFNIYPGHPIVNDPIYNDYVWGPEKGKGGIYHKSDEQVRTLSMTLYDCCHYFMQGHNFSSHIC